jgi:hypothetical protein
MDLADPFGRRVLMFAWMANYGQEIALPAGTELMFDVSRRGNGESAQQLLLSPGRDVGDRRVAAIRIFVETIQARHVQPPIAPPVRTENVCSCKGCTLSSAGVDQAARTRRPDLHRFVRGVDGPGRPGPPDETCGICQLDPRNEVHQVVDLRHDGVCDCVSSAHCPGGKRASQPRCLEVDLIRMRDLRIRRPV